MLILSDSRLEDDIVLILYTLFILESCLIIFLYWTRWRLCVFLLWGKLSAIILGDSLTCLVIINLSSLTVKSPFNDWSSECDLREYPYLSCMNLLPITASIFIVKLTLLPYPMPLDFTVTSPPLCLTICYTIVRPRPIPSWFICAVRCSLPKREKSLGMSLAAMPTPVSLTLTWRHCSS